MWGFTKLHDLVEILVAEGVREKETDGRGLIEVDMCPVFVCPQLT